MLTVGAAYRAAAERYLRVEAARWAAQLRLETLIRAGAAPDQIRRADVVTRAAAAGLAAATRTLDCCEAACRAAIPNPLVVP